MKSKVIELLNKNLANIQVIYIKLHNYHWNVKGITFKAVHELTEFYYGYFAKLFDEVAERIVQLGGKPFASMKEYLNNAAIKEESKNDFDGIFVLGSIRNDFELMNKEFKDISKIAEELEDSPTAALADENIAWLEKQIWMINATMG
ncbi:Dps family protein [Melioribacter sp. OK-6-Me]|uniref:Dps family protein n=1 Tax=unclassified Melioribacter TaxID=2627329 RepID=UPI003ED9D946